MGVVPETAIASLTGVTKTFGEHVALSDVTLELPEGQIVGLLGPNGAGKTTLVSLLQGLRVPTAGTVRLFGGDPRSAASRQHLGSTPQETALPALLTAREVIDFVGRNFEDRLTPAELSAQFDLGDLLDRRAGALSGGQRRRLSVALAFVARPRLVLLDEPTTGLDVDARRALWEALVLRHREGATLVVSSHYLEEIEALAQRVIVLNRGRVLADDSVSGVLDRVGRHLVEFVAPALGPILAATGAAPEDVVIQEGTGRARIAVADSDGFVRALVSSGAAFSDLTVRGASLEEAFLALTGEDAISPTPPGGAGSASPEGGDR